MSEKIIFFPLQVLLDLTFANQYEEMEILALLMPVYR